MDAIVKKYVIVPLIAVIGIYVVGTLISDLIGIPGAVISLFGAVGGILFFAKFYKRR